MKEDNLVIQSEKLVGASKIMAVSMYKPMLDRFPFIIDVDLEHWDFIVIIASVFIAVKRLNKIELDEELKDKIIDIFSENLEKDYGADSFRFIEDCKSFFDKKYIELVKDGYDKNFVASDALGLWIVSNLTNKELRNLTKEDLNLACTIGRVIVVNFFDWWSNK